jgi:hypothetical protein
MTTIDPTGRLLAYVREQAPEWGRKPGLAGEKLTQNPDKNNPRASNDWKTILARKVAAISKDDPQPRRRAFRIYLELTLVQEFGTELANDHAFNALVDKVQTTMESDPNLTLVLDRAITLILVSTLQLDKAV